MAIIFNSIISKIKSLNKKNKRIIINMIISFFVKGAALLVSLFTLPAYMRFFEDKSVLGLWFTVISLLSWVLSFDLGIGNGLRNKLVKPLTENNFLKVKGYISSAYVMLGTFVFFISFIGYVASQYINWNTIFNISKQLVSPNVLLITVRLIFASIMLQFFLRIISSILYAMQKSAIPGLLLLVSNSLLLLFVLLAKSGNLENNLQELAIANIFTTNLPLLLVTLYLFSTKLRKSIPSIKYFKKIYAIDIFMLGGIFFWLQIMFMVISNTNEFLITWLIGPEKVVDYKIYNSLFAVIGTLFTLALTPMWSEVTEAYEKKEYNWIKKIYKKLYIFASIAIVLEVLLIFVLQIVINFWLSDKAITVNYDFALVFAISGAVFIWNAVLSSIVNGLGKLKIPFIFHTLGAVINIPLAYLFVQLTGSWISIVLANVISMLPTCIMQAVWLNKYFKIIILENNVS